MDFWITWSKKCLETARGQNRAVRIITSQIMLTHFLVIINEL
jgi:hypothetical protein